MLRRLTILIFCCLATPVFAEFEHLGQPPKGAVFLTLVGQTSMAPLQFMGTLSPPTLLLNGRPLPLEEYEPSPEELKFPSKGLWLNGKPKEISGEVGRYFFQLAGPEAEISQAKIVLQTPEGSFLRAFVPINRCFLDSPLYEKKVVDETELKDEHVFQFGGKIPEDSQLTIEGGKVDLLSETEVNVEMKIPLGNSTLSAKLRQKDGSTRLINLPVVLSQEKYSPKKITFSLVVPRGQKINQRWNLPYYGEIIRGMTNPDAKVTYKGRVIDVRSTGEFEIEILPHPETKEWEAEFEVSLGGSTEVFTKPLSCSSCSAAGQWYAPRYRKANEMYIYAPLSELAFLAPRSGNVVSDEFRGKPVTATSSFISPVFGAGFGYYLNYRTSLEGMFKFLFSLEGESHSRTLKAQSTLIFVGLLQWAWAPRFSLGVGPIMLFTKLSTQGYVSSIAGSNKVLGAAFRMLLRFPLSQQLEVTPSLTLSPSQAQIALSGSPVKFHYISIQPIGVRFFLGR